MKVLWPTHFGRLQAATQVLKLFAVFTVPTACGWWLCAHLWAEFAVNNSLWLWLILPVLLPITFLFSLVTISIDFFLLLALLGLLLGKTRVETMSSHRFTQRGALRDVTPNNIEQLPNV